MRVQLRDEQGAVAVMVALLLVVLVGLAAFITDFGVAYVSKRQIQSSADAAALAAAQELGTYAGTCTDVANSSTARAAAQAVAEQFASANRAGDRVRTDWRVACSSDHRTLEVTYANAATTPRLLGAIFGSAAYRSERTATAAVGVPSGGYGLRPYFVCLSDAVALRDAASSASPVRVAFPNSSCGNQSGNWYTADCPEDGQGNGTPVLATNTRLGCESSVSVVDTSAAGGDPVAVRQLLLAACSGSPPLSGTRGCLTGNTGNLPSNPIETEWQALLGKEISLPVFEPGTVVGTGNNARYPVKAILGVTVCGYKWNSKSGRSTAFVCNGVTIPSGNDNYLWLRYTSLQVSGSSAPYVCPLGDASCDFGARSVRLVK